MLHHQTLFKQGYHPLQGRVVRKQRSLFMVKSLRKRMCCNIFLTFDFIPAAQLPSCPSLGQPGLMPRLPERCLGCSSAAHGTFNARRQGGVEGNVAAATSHTCAPRRICVPCHYWRRRACATPELAHCSAIAGLLQGCCLLHIL